LSLNFFPRQKASEVNALEETVLPITHIGQVEILKIRMGRDFLSDIFKDLLEFWCTGYFQHFINRHFRVVLSHMGEELGVSQSNILLWGSIVNVTISDMKLQARPEPYKLSLDAYWKATFGDETREDSRILEIEVVKIFFEVDFEPYTVQSNESFTLTYQITNVGNDRAYAVETELASLAGFNAED